MKCWQLILVSVYLTASIVVCEDSTNSPATSDSGSTDEVSHLEKGVKTLYEMTHNFLDLLGTQDFFSSTHSGAITYKDIEVIVKNGTYSDLQTRWQDLVKVWGPFAACVIVALLFIIFMPIAGCCFCCCFCCCKKCGKATDKHDPPRARCKRITLCTFLFIFTTLMMTGAIVAAIANEILHQKLENVNNQGPIGKFDNSLNIMQKLATDTVTDIQNVGSTVLDTTVDGVLIRIEDAANNAVVETKKYIKADTLLKQTEKLGEDVDTSLSNLNKVTTSVAELKQLSTNISEEFYAVSSAISSACSLPECDVSGLSVKSDFNVVPDLSSVTSNVESAQSLTNETKKATDEFKTVEKTVNETINSQITDAKKSAEQIKKDVGQNLDKVNATVFPLIQSVTDNIRPQVNEADETLKKNGDYWWYGGIVASCLVLLVVLCYYLGILFGIFGDRPGQGAQCCNRGAGSNFFVCGVLCSYLCASILMLVVMITFLTGGLFYTVICRDLNNGVENIKNIENILDDTADLSLRKLLYPDNKSIDLTIGGMLDDCRQNKALYTAFKLKYQFDIDQLLNISDVTSELTKALDNSLKFDNISIIPPDLKSSLTNFSTSGVTTINFTSFDEQISKNNLSKVVDKMITDLTAIVSVPATPNKTEIQTQIHVLESLKNQQITEFESKLQNLNTSLHNLQAFNTLQNTTQDIINGLTNAQNSFNTNATVIVEKMLKDVVHNTTSFVESEINGIRQKIKDDIGKCRGLYDAAQSISDAICKVVLDPFNAFWFGLGWGLFFYIPSIIFALCLANLYQRQEKYNPVQAQQHQKNRKKKKGKDTEQFDSPDMEMYHGGGYNAYNNDQRDNLPLTTQYRGGYKGGPDGVHNHGYEDHYRQGGNRGYDAPPPYTAPRGAGQQAYPVLPQHY